MPDCRADNRNPRPIAAAIVLILPALFAGGCSEPGDVVWFNSEKTLQQAEEDISYCYFKAFLARRENPAPEEFTNIERDPRDEIEAAAGKCMKKAGYRSIAAAKVKPPIRIKNGVAHSMDYSIAGE